MAKVVITIDTDELNDDKEHIIHASIDGEDIPNMSDININKFGDFISIELTAVEHEEGGLFVKRTSFSAFAEELVKNSGIKLVMKKVEASSNLESILEKMGKKQWTRS